jgi:long-chain acyl-CoA synthetase
MALNSIIDYVRLQVEKKGSATAALTKRDGKYVPVSWQEMWDEGQQVAKGIAALGVDAGAHVCLMSATRFEWVVTDLGILSAGGVTVPIYPSNLPEECAYIAHNSESVLVFAEDASQVQKFLDKKSEVPNVRHVVQMTGAKKTDDPWVLSWDAFIAGGKAIADASIRERTATLNKDSILTIIYTSGTTGVPKGVVLTHGNMLYEGQAVHQVDVVRENDVQLLFLPLAHVFAKVLEVAWFSVGFTTAFAENMNTIRQNLGEVRPTLMAGVPRVFEKFYAAVVEKGTSATGMKKTLFLKAMELSQKNGELEEQGKALGFLESIQFSLLKRLVFAKVGTGIMDILGGRMRVMVSGGAPLSKKIAWFFRDAGIVILEGYGMTESSAGATINLPHRNQIGTVGPAFPGTEIKIAEDGEILLRGPLVMREYWRNGEATAETVIDGWLHTGDIGELDPHTGALRITDRKKDLIVTAGGKNVAPQKIENLLKTHKLIANAVVHGDKRKFLSALITLDADQLKVFAEQRNLQGSYAELTAHPTVLEEIKRLVEESNRELASYESIKAHKVLDKDFSVETGELTPKLSVKRKVVDKRYGHIFDAFYDEKF